MVQQIAWILINTERTGTLQFILSITAGEKADAERLCALSGEQVPHAVPYHYRFLNINIKARGSRQEQIRIRLRPLYLVSRNTRATNTDTYTSHASPPTSP